MTAQTAHDQALSKAKIALMSKPDSVFFTTLCFSLKFKWNDDIPTAGVDGESMFINPKFFLSLDPKERVFVLVHESLHMALLHLDPARLKSRDKKRWNEAADHVINLMLQERGYSMPNWVLKDPRFKGMSTEQVYKLLPESEGGNGSGGTNQMQGDLLEAPGDPQEAQHKIQDIIVRASIQSKMAGDAAGTIPGEIEIFLDNLLNPKLPWQTILRKYVQSYAKTDYSFRKPNRRFFPEHILPSQFGESLIDLAIAVDTSGSVSDHDFKVFVSEVGGIFKMMKPKKITLIQFDTKIKAVDQLHSFDELSKVHFVGRGGTQIHEVIEWANTHKPQLLMVFSDGDFRFPQLQAKSKTLWFIHNNPGFVPPFGKVINYEI